MQQYRGNMSNTLPRGRRRGEEKMQTHPVAGSSEEEARRVGKIEIRTMLPRREGRTRVLDNRSHGSGIFRDPSATKCTIPAKGFQATKN